MGPCPQKRMSSRLGSAPPVNFFKISPDGAGIEKVKGGFEGNGKIPLGRLEKVLPSWLSQFRFAKPKVFLENAKESLVL